MPSSRIANKAVSLDLFDVIGVDPNGDGFICHVGLAKTKGIQAETNVEIIDMGPPLHGMQDRQIVTASAIGTADLTDDEASKIKVFVDRHSSEHAVFRTLTLSGLLRAAPNMYTILPHASAFEEEDGRYTRTRFSCSGFVLEAYRFAEIELLDLTNLPEVDFQGIRSAYPTQCQLLDSGKLSADSLGLNGDGPWRVLLCGYLLHAFNRDTDVIRSQAYKPSAQDAHFASAP